MKLFIHNLHNILLSLTTVALLTACGGSDGSNSSSGGSDSGGDSVAPVSLAYPVILMA